MHFCIVDSAGYGGHQDIFKVLRIVHRRTLTLWSVVVFISGSSTGLKFCIILDVDGRPSNVNVNSLDNGFRASSGQA